MATPRIGTTDQPQDFNLEIIRKKQFEHQLKDLASKNEALKKQCSSLLAALPRDSTSNKISDYLSEVLYHLASKEMELLRVPDIDKTFFSFHDEKIKDFTLLIKKGIKSEAIHGEIDTFFKNSDEYLKSTREIVTSLNDHATKANELIFSFLENFVTGVQKTLLTTSQANDDKKIDAIIKLKIFYYKAKMEEKSLLRKYCFHSNAGFCDWCDNSYKEKPSDPLSVNKFFKNILDYLNYENLDKLIELVNEEEEDYSRYFNPPANDNGHITSQWKKTFAELIKNLKAELKPLVPKPVQKEEVHLEQQEVRRKQELQAVLRREQEQQAASRKEQEQQARIARELQHQKNIHNAHQSPVAKSTTSRLDNQPSSGAWKTPTVIAVGVILSLIILGAVVLASHGVALPFLLAVGGAVLAGHGGATVALGAGLGIFSAGAATVGAAIGYAAKKVTGLISSLFNKKSHDVSSSPKQSSDSAKTNLPPKMQSVPALLQPSNTQSDKKVIGSASQPCLFKLRESSPLQMPGVGFHAGVRSNSATDKAASLTADANAAATLRRRHTYTQVAH